MYGYKMARARDEYFSLRRAYSPENPTLIIVAESPPASGLYFYDPGGAVTESLFAALMKQLGISPKTKESGLQALKRRGWILVDATYEPVNKLSKNGVSRDEVILRDYPMLRADIAELADGRSIPIILVKVNVCQLLEPKLTGDGFTVLNQGCRVHFPSNGRQTDFHRQFGAILTHRIHSDIGSEPGS